ncbi:MAG: helix-turn-helix transcriptional regulator [Flavipsychrobacter sp.]|nr:helix-turn-helix transcriptional regulator [Flavipsychrobacter sp.]
MGQVRDEQLLKDIALRVKALREGSGFSQEEVYNATEIHVARIETAKVNVTISTLAKLCDFFEISLAEFFKPIHKS